MGVLLYSLFASFILCANIDIVQILDENDSLSNSVAFNIYSDDDAYGIQFDIFYDKNNLLITSDHLQSTLSGIQVWSKFVKDGHVKILMFSLSYNKLVEAATNDPSDFLHLSFTPINGFTGNSTIQISNVLLAGPSGREIPITEGLGYDLEVKSPSSYMLNTNFPNPFKEKTTIPYEVSNPGLIKINIFNSDEILVSTLIEEYIEPGYYIVEWDGRDKLGQILESGRYRVTMSSDELEVEESITITLLK